MGRLFFTNSLDCSGESFNGSAIHFSCNTFDRPTEVLYNNFSQLNEVGDSIMKHSEGGLTFSAKVRELRVAYNTLLEVGENGIGNFLNDDQSNEITDNLLDTKLATVGGLNQFYRYNSTNIIYNNKNLNFADTSARSCFQYIPQLKTAFECSGNSSAEEPLVVGDSITITLDSLQIRNSNENFLKCIEPIYNDRYFELTSIKMQTDTLSLHHKWQFNGNALCFDNGHRNGIYGHGNWGYQGCGEGENCSDIKMTFVVKNLPDSLSQVTCPLQGFEFDYDGDLGTWNRPVLCERTTVELDSKKLGKPFLEGTFISVSQDFRLNEAIKIYPNPNPTYINIDFLMPAKVNFLISNTLGQEVSSGILNSKTLHIEDLKNGIYFLVLNVNGQRVTKTFVKN